MNEPVIIRSGRRAAVSAPGARQWILVPTDRLVDGLVPPSVGVRLQRSGPGSLNDPTIVPRVLQRGGDGSILRSPVIALLVWSAPLIFAAMSWLGWIAGATLEEPLDLLAALGVALLVCAWGTWMTVAALRTIDTTGPAPVWGVRFGWPVVEPVVWRLDTGAGAPLAALAAAALWALVAAIVLPGHPALGLAMAFGAWLLLVRAAWPLGPSPLMALAGTWAGIDDAARQLRWTIVTRFLLPASRVPVTGGWRLALLALIPPLWLGLVAGGLSLLGRPELTGESFAAFLWRLLLAVGGVLYVVWVVWYFARLLRASWRLAATALELCQPEPADLEALRQGPLLRHVPILADVEWEWLRCPAGSAIVSWGGRDRDYYWIARGSCDVIIRSSDGDPLHVATLTAGTGFGEIGLLEDQPRTADVIAGEDVVLARLPFEQWRTHGDEAAAAQLRAVTQAGQAIARSDLFFGLDPADRARWLAAGHGQTFEPGTAIMRDGDADRWMALIVDGTARVEKGGQELARLAPDTVVGEAAWLTGAPRSADVIAQERVLLWRWDPEWLDAAPEALAMREALEALARSRGLAA
ncbi:MAG: cyclic nucleotide-binding domain-containing protein [Candidatus Dadabacteria bacterium]|nr:MAG: cyclic nucleotide-binding domain-containing protein [Candidatus Dadabacteria bacterium]